MTSALLSKYSKGNPIISTDKYIITEPKLLKMLELSNRIRVKKVREVRINCQDIKFSII